MPGRHAEPGYCAADASAADKSYRCHGRGNRGPQAIIPRRTGIAGMFSLPPLVRPGQAGRPQAAVKDGFAEIDRDGVADDSQACGRIVHNGLTV
jgi:hypothetical protein